MAAALVTVAAALVTVAAALVPAPVAQAHPDQQRMLSSGAVVALQSTPHLWVADDQGMLHWSGDTRALAGRAVDWSSRQDVPLDRLKALTRGDPWLSAGLVKIGDPIYFVKWETNAAQPTLLHIQSIADMELFGVNSTNYGTLVLDQTTWEQRYGMSTAGLPKGELPSAAPVTPLVVGPRYNGQAPSNCFWMELSGRQVYACVYPDNSNAVWRGPSDPTLLATISPAGKPEVTPAGRDFWVGESAPVPVSPAPVRVPVPISPVPVPAAPPTSGAFEATVTNDFTGYAADKVFVLDNGQIWQQAESYYSYSYSYRPEVLIYPTGGGWKMHYDPINHDVFVKRIK